jgi:hypothetical protein
MLLSLCWFFGLFTKRRTWDTGRPGAIADEKKQRNFSLPLDTETKRTWRGLAAAGSDTNESIAVAADIISWMHG